MVHYSHSISLFPLFISISDATCIIMVSENSEIIVEHVIIFGIIGGSELNVQINKNFVKTCALYRLCNKNSLNCF